MSTELYPLSFNPIFKERIWGGEKLKTYLNKPIISAITGESWEISSIPGSVSTVANGKFKGESLTQLIEKFPEEMLGNKVFKKFGLEFPLLFKYLDAHQDLSIQVHPSDALALKRHNCFGKTEMWYVLQADENAKTIVGFKEKSNPIDFKKNIENKTVETILNTIHPQKGDVFFLETGTIHALGAGVVVAEIQQTSDITYRIYDFDRKDSNGNKRELQVDLAIDAINYNKSNVKLEYKKNQNTSNTVINCQFFTTNFIPLQGEMNIQKSGESFTVYMCVDGNFQLNQNNSIYSYKKGDTVLIPASMKSYKINGNASILEIYIS